MDAKVKIIKEVVDAEVITTIMEMNVDVVKSIMKHLW